MYIHTTVAGYCLVIPQSSFQACPRDSQKFNPIFAASYHNSCSLQGLIHFTFDFHFSVAKEVTNLISSAHAPPEDLLDSTHSHLTAPESHTPTQDISASPKKLVLETSVGDRRLWYEILRNLSKDLSKSSSILLPESALSNIETYHSKLFQRDASDDLGGNGESKMAATSFGGSEKLNGTGEFVVFTCGHAFPLSRFHSKVILEISNRVSDLPVSIPHTLRYLQLHYKQSSYNPNGCPYCVFQYLRKIQLYIQLYPSNHGTLDSDIFFFFTQYWNY